MEVPTFAVGTGFHSGGLTEGHQIFVDALARFAEQSHNSRLTPIIRGIAAPLRIAVMGRDGVGRGTGHSLRPELRRRLLATLDRFGIARAVLALSEGADDACAYLRRAVQWRRYSRGPVGALHCSCGADIARGSLRLVGRAR